MKLAEQLAKEYVEETDFISNDNRRIAGNAFIAGFLAGAVAQENAGRDTLSHNIGASRGGDSGLLDKPRGPASPDDACKTCNGTKRQFHPLHGSVPCQPCSRADDVYFFCRQCGAYRDDYWPACGCPGTQKYQTPKPEIDEWWSREKLARTQQATIPLISLCDPRQGAGGHRFATGSNVCSCGKTGTACKGTTKGD